MLHTTETPFAPLEHVNVPILATMIVILWKIGMLPSTPSCVHLWWWQIQCAKH